MSSKVYRSALGKPVDMGSLLLKNENVRAVGNMGVNAKGDVIDKKNDSVMSKTQQVNQQYRKQIRNQIEDVPIANTNIISNKTDVQIEGFDDAPLTVEEIAKEAEPVQAESETKTTKTTESKKSGLASAIAKARKLEQVKLKTPREESRETKGVKKI